MIAEVMSPSGEASSVMPTLWSSRHTHAAASIGLVSITTENDTENEPMLRINTRLGFRPGPELVQYAKTL